MEQAMFMKRQNQWHFLGLTESEEQIAELKEQELGGITGRSGILTQAVAIVDIESLALTRNQYQDEKEEADGVHNEPADANSEGP